MRMLSVRVLTQAWRVTILAALMMSSLGAQDAPRVVALGGSVTEIVFALGAGEHLVGVDQSSVAAPGAARLARVSNFRSLSAEGVLSLAPTVVIATTEAGPASALAQLRAAGVRVHLVPAAESIDEAAAKIRAVGAALGSMARADSLATRVAAEARRAASDAVAMADRHGRRPVVLFIYARGAGSLFVAGTRTIAASMIGLAAGTNAVSAFEGFRPLTAEAVVAAAPDVIVIPSRGLASVGGVAGLRRLPGVALTPAGRHGRIVTVDDGLLLGFGPRLAEGIRSLAAGVHSATSHAATP